MNLRTLLTLQFISPALAVGYLALSYAQERAGGPRFSTAPPLPAMALFFIYMGLLFLGAYRRHTAYRIACALAIPMLAYGGVLMKVLNYFRTGLEGYSSLAAWSIGTASTTYGVVWNIVAAQAPLPSWNNTAPKKGKDSPRGFRAERRWELMSCRKQICVSS